MKRDELLRKGGTTTIPKSQESFVQNYEIREAKKKNKKISVIWKQTEKKSSAELKSVDAYISVYLKNP